MPARTPRPSVERLVDPSAHLCRAKRRSPGRGQLMSSGCVAMLDRCPARRQGIIAALQQAGLTVDHYADEAPRETEGSAEGAMVARWQQNFISWALSGTHDAVLIADHDHPELIRALREKRDDLSLIAL